jgi:hypothetical protein
MSADTPKPPKARGPYYGFDAFDDLLAAKPEIFDDSDCRPGPSALSDEYSDSLVPEHLRERVMASRRAERAANCVKGELR